MPLFKTYVGVTNIQYVRINVRSDGTIFFSFSNRRYNFGEIPEAKINAMCSQIKEFAPEDISQYDYMIDCNWEYFSNTLDDPEFKQKTNEEKWEKIEQMFNFLNLDSELE